MALIFKLFKKSLIRLFGKDGQWKHLPVSETLPSSSKYSVTTSVLRRVWAVMSRKEGVVLLVLVGLLCVWLYYLWWRRWWEVYETRVQMMMRMTSSANYPHPSPIYLTVSCSSFFIHSFLHCWYFLIFFTFSFSHSIYISYFLSTRFLHFSLLRGGKERQEHKSGRLECSAFMFLSLFSSALIFLSCFLFIHYLLSFSSLSHL